MKYVEPIARLVKALSGLPGIGEKTASRLALYILNSRRDVAEELSKSVLSVKDNVRLCSECMTFSESDPCAICSDVSRDKGIICVVGDYKDLVALENSGSYKGAYHVLHGLLAPLKGIGPEEIKVNELIARASRSKVTEIILATGFDSEGEATALYIKRALKDFGVRLTRIASGIPAGGFVEYMDPTTLGRAMEGRKEA
ncbi:MAG: recombination mediator RecR [Deltaproteobacteria bacterium]|nr:recombination mediator RecR [Deltaproteobacteria bacterium]